MGQNLALSNGNLNLSNSAYRIALPFGAAIVIAVLLVFAYLLIRSRYRDPLPDTVGLANDRTFALHTFHSNDDNVVAGIDHQTLDSFPKMLYSEKVHRSVKSAEGKEEEEEEAQYKKCCPICLSDYKESEVVRVIPDCRHMFHMDCIDKWLHLHLTCPMCRSTSSFPPLQSSP